MREIYRQVLDNIPDYKEFLTLEELEASSRALAENYPETVSLFEFGKTKEGLPLSCLKIGSGSHNALMFGCPHPNEPIGTMMLEYFTEQLASNKAFRDELDYTWYVVKAWDADGLKLNEGWLKGPYSIYHYSRHFFRPAGHKQVDWTFPIDYKKLHFHAPIPETAAMMELIDRIRPSFIYSLHNAGFGGVYWYISAPLDELYDDMRAAADRAAVPLNLGEPEAPYCIALSPAVYKSLGIEQEYDYLERYGETDIEKKIKVGTCSESYARERYGSFTLLTELPYFYDKRIMDLSEGGVTRREAALAGLEADRESNAYIRTAVEKARPFVDAENPFLLALEAFSEDTGYESKRKMIETDPIFAKTATVAEEFDNLQISKFYKSLSYGMLIRMSEYELARMRRTGERNPERKAALAAAAKEAEAVHRAYAEALERELNYEVVPIRKLVSIQLESGLLVCDYLKGKQPLK
ncbi:MAG: hypothetical protein LLF87_10640 [Eubacteriales bacterium]|nr:hypothetical protein [Eubacteriales bacterium]